jgi:pimeloyl-ACP methyl ester carboxylesterase
VTAPAGPRTSQLEGPHGSLEFITTGSGLPATVFAHGLTGSIETTRPFGSGVKGSRTFFHFQGHGGSVAAETPWTYPELASQLRSVADHVGATQALGVSMGAGALCALLADTPSRFDRVVFVLPAVLDRPGPDDAPPHTARSVLAAVAAPALVIAQEQDPAHPVWVAEQLAASLPGARLKVMSPGGILRRHRQVMRDLIGGFLSGEPPSTGQSPK